MVNAATSPCASGAILRASSTAPLQVESPLPPRFKLPVAYTPANTASTPTTTTPAASGSRLFAAGRGGGVSGISFVILYQIRLCSAHVTVEFTAETGAAFRWSGR